VKKRGHRSIYLPITLAFSIYLVAAHKAGYWNDVKNTRRLLDRVATELGFTRVRTQDNSVIESNFL